MTIKPFLRAAECLLTLGAAFVTAVPADAAPANLTVAPGQHLGRVFIGDTKTDGDRRLGAPQSTFKLQVV